MSLYKRLKENDLVQSEKEYNELIHIRQIKINDKPIDEPNLQLVENKKYKITIGILTKEI